MRSTLRLAALAGALSGCAVLADAGPVQPATSGGTGLQLPETLVIPTDGGPALLTIACRANVNALWFSVPILEDEIPLWERVLLRTDRPDRSPEAAASHRACLESLDVSRVDWSEAGSPESSQR